MGPGNSLMRDLLWGLSDSENKKIRVCASLATSKVAPAHEKPVPIALPVQNHVTPPVISPANNVPPKDFSTQSWNNKPVIAQEPFIVSNFGQPMPNQSQHF